MEKNHSKILCLHGYGQNAHIFGSRIKSLQKQLNKKFNNRFEYLIPDAPFILENEDQKIENEIVRGWLKFEKVDNYYKCKTIKLLGLKEGIDTIFKLGDENQDIEVILSFSQGSIIIILIIILSLYKSDKYNIKEHFPNLKCLICVSGFISPFPENEEFKDIVDQILNKDEKLIKKIDIPMMNVYGENDQFVDVENFKVITKFFSNYEVFNHKGKHFVPSSKADINRYEEFLEKYLKNI